MTIFYSLAVSLADRLGFLAECPFLQLLPLAIENFMDFEELAALSQEFELQLPRWQQRH